MGRNIRESAPAYGAIVALCLASALTPGHRAMAQRSAPAFVATAPQSAPEAGPAAATVSATRPGAMSGQELLKERARLAGEILKQFEARDYPMAAGICRQFIKLFPQLPDGHYNLACALARLGNNDLAVESLQKAVSLGYDDAEHMAADDDLESLKDRKDFADVLEQARAAAMKYDEMPGVKTVVRQPKDGLRYRLRMSPTATKDKPNKLIIWLHPSGASGNAGVEPMATMFLKHGYALAVFPKKNFAAWSDQDADMLMDKTLPDMAAVEGIDATKPIGLGFSAGGQLALLAWAQDPAFFGGLILDAAYPVAQTPNGLRITDLPDKPGVADTPILVFVGLDDGGAKVWQKVEPKWLAKGVPLTVVYVPNAPHAWLLTEKHASQRAELDKWLSAVSAGKKPASHPASQPASRPPVAGSRVPWLRIGAVAAAFAATPPVVSRAFLTIHGARSAIAGALTVLCS